MTQVAAHRDEAAFNRLFRHLSPRLQHWLWNTGSSIQVAEDLAQEAFASLWRKASQFDSSRANVAAWLFTIARNLRVDRFRGAAELIESLDEHDSDQFVSPDPSPEALLLAKQQAERIRWALRQLPEEHSSLFRLAYYDQKSQSIIAADLSLPLGTVKTRMRRASARLRDLLVGC